MTKTKTRTCAVCGKGCGKATLDSAISGGPAVFPVDRDRLDRAIRLAHRALAATSGRETKRWAARARDMGAPAAVLEALKRAEPLAETACCGKSFHAGCDPESVGECISCGAWSCGSVKCCPPGKGCPYCGSGKTKSGKAERTPPTPEELAAMERRITGREVAPPLPDKRREAIERMKKMLADAEEGLNG